MKIKHLTQVGNSSALVIEKPILDLLNIDEKTPLKVTTDGRRLIIEPLTEAEIEQRFGKALDKADQKYGRVFKRLAEK